MIVEHRVRVICGDSPVVEPARIVVGGGDTLIIEIDRPGVKVFTPLGPAVFEDGKDVYAIEGREVRFTLRSAADIKAELGKFVNKSGELECPCSAYCAESNKMAVAKVERGSAPVIIIKIV